ncbi:MAG: ABC transporter permease [Chloracidobacterium sp.]|nr:ABC transporter permease [Chloracidobacterium sp.]
MFDKLLQLWRRLFFYVRRDQFDRELEEEMRLHLEMKAAENIAAGISPEEARYAARRQFGNQTLLREMSRDLWAVRSIETLFQDLRFGARTLFKTKALTLVAALSLGLGIGATSAIYALVDQLLIHDVTARDPERLVSINYGPWCSYPNFRDIRSSGVFAGLAADTGCYPEPRWREGGRTHSVPVRCVSGNFFEVMGWQATLGRVFTDTEAVAEKDPRVVVISHHFWRGRLGGDPNVVGRVLTLNYTAYTIIGVLPDNIRGNYGEIIVPFSADLYPRLFERDSTTMGFIGRLLPGRTPEQTQQALMVVLRGLAARFPDNMKLNQESPPKLTPVLGLAKLGKGSWEMRFSAMLAVVAVLVLLIACANVAGLLLAQGVARRREIAVRLAVGATPRRLIRQFMVESALLSAAGTAAGVGLAFLASGVLRKFPLQGSYMRFEFTTDWRFACAAAALGGVAAFVSGLVPALASSRLNLSNAMRVSHSMTPRLRLRSLLVVAQITVSVILLFGAFVFIRNLTHVLRFDPGFDASHTLELDLTTTDPKIYPVALREKVYREIEAYPGVEAVSWAWYMPFNLVYGEYQLRRLDVVDAAGFKVTAQGIGPGYLKTMRIPLLAGRELDWNDVPLYDKADVEPAIVNQAFARKYFPDRNPVGERLSRGNNKQVEIIGVSADTSFVNSLGEEPEPLIQPLSNLRHSFIVRVAGSPTTIAPEIAKLIERNAPGAAVGFFTSLEQLDKGVRATRLATVLLSVLAALGLVLALIGLCGISIYNVERRTPEIGLRLALGATPGQVFRLTLGEGFTLVVAGATLGIAGAFLATRLLRGFLAAGVSPLDPLAFAAMLATLLFTAAVSVYFPSRRAARVDPLASLRHE